MSLAALLHGVVYVNIVLTVVAALPTSCNSPLSRFGRVYILAMLWSTATSLLVHNTGLPAGVLISFVWVMGGLTIGWILINIHQVKRHPARENL